MRSTKSTTSETHTTQQILTPVHFFVIFRQKRLPLRGKASIAATIHVSRAPATSHLLSTLSCSPIICIKYALVLHGRRPHRLQF